MKVYIGPHRKNRAVNVRIDKYDTWNLDHTLALIILPALKQFKKKLHGYPGDLSEKQWDDVLNKMIWSFEAVLDEKEGVDTIEENNRIQEGLELFGKYYRSLWD